MCSRSTRKFTLVSDGKLISNVAVFDFDAQNVSKLPSFNFVVNFPEATILVDKARFLGKVFSRADLNSINRVESALAISPSRFTGTFNNKFAPRPTEPK